MARTSRVSAEQLENARKKLLDLPVKDTSKTTKETIVTLSRDIQNALKKGYSLEEISNLLKDVGISVTKSTLKSYMANTSSKNKVDLNTDKTSKVNKEKEIRQDEGDFVKPDLPDNEI